MSHVLPPGLADYREKFRELEADIQDANYVKKPLCPCRETEIQAAVNHTFSIWLDQHPSFKAARKKIEKNSYYQGVPTEYRQRWWVEVKYKLAIALFGYYEYRKPEVIKRLKNGSLQGPFLSYGRKTKKTKKMRIAELAKELLSEIQSVYVLPTIAKSISLNELLTELISCLESGKTSKLGLSKLHKNFAREAMIKLLVTASSTFTGEIFNSIILDFVSIADPNVDRDTVDRFVAEMRAELEAGHREKLAKAAKPGNMSDLPVNDVCRFCGLPITHGNPL